MQLPPRAEDRRRFGLALLVLGLFLTAGGLALPWVSVSCIATCQTFSETYSTVFAATRGPIETYGVSLPDDNLRALEARLTPAQGVMLMPKAFINFSAPGEIDDAHLAAAAHAQAEYAVRDPRVIGLRPFLWCVERYANCDDVARPTDLFYPVGGSKLPMTQAAFRSIGHAILGR